MDLERRNVLSDPEKLNTIVVTGSMEDVGTRISHLLDLYNLWNVGLDILERFDKSTPFYDVKKTELESAINLLNWHMEKDYKESEYRAIIDQLPKAEDIK